MPRLVTRIAKSASADLKEYNSADGDVSIMLARHDLIPILSFEDTERNMEAACSKSFNGWRQVMEEQRSLRGGSGIAQKGTLEPNSTLRVF